MGRMKRLAFDLIIVLPHAKTQELYVSTEPASNMAIEASA
jgi:hypothetical protein